ncbi:GNAT family acetyltransferase [Caballeronia novacaledonica]|uniref:GNAT family acetyltransferase n=1 Tax=Caballeronia novacaledonica TaxID=1544861 RepID=UPI001EE31B89|nr:GNAT family acetyltransferase [Caballeronia novacaledonica]GJH13869.1 GNAT family acetyltransferase [Caballeronia novacaledonica]
MIIRTFDAGDRDAVIALWRDVFPEYADASRPQRDPALSIANKMKMQPELFFVGAVDGEVIGTVMAGYDGHRGWVYSLAVTPSLRGRGYGRALMMHAEAVLAKLGCPKVNLQILSVKTELRGFYEKLGYRVDEVVSLGKRL